MGVPVALGAVVHSILAAIHAVGDQTAAQPAPTWVMEGLGPRGMHAPDEAHDGGRGVCGAAGLVLHHCGALVLALGGDVSVCMRRRA